MNGNNICFTIAPFPVPFPNRQYANIITALMFIIIMSKYSLLAFLFKNVNPFLNLLILKNPINNAISNIKAIVKFIISSLILIVYIGIASNSIATTNPIYAIALAIKFAMIRDLFS